MSANRKLAAVPDLTAPTPLTFFRHLDYPDATVFLAKGKAVKFQSFFYTTTDPTEIALLRAKGGAIVEDSGEPEYRCQVPGCSFVTLKPLVLEGHMQSAHPSLG